MGYFSANNTRACLHFKNGDKLPSNKENSADNIEILVSYLTPFGKI